MLLQQHGLKNVSELDWGDSVAISGLKFHFLEAVHSSRRGLSDTDKSLWGSFLIQTPEGNIYFAGDTAYGRQFNKVYECFGPPELAFLPIGAYKPRWFMAREHMDPEEWCGHTWISTAARVSPSTSTRSTPRKKALMTQSTT